MFSKYGINVGYSNLNSKRDADNKISGNGGRRAFGVRNGEKFFFIFVAFSLSHLSNTPNNVFLFHRGDDSKILPTQKQAATPMGWLASLENM